MEVQAGADEHVVDSPRTAEARELVSARGVRQQQAALTSAEKRRAKGRRPLPPGGSGGSGSAAGVLPPQPPSVRVGGSFDPGAFLSDSENDTDDDADNEPTTDADAPTTASVAEAVPPPRVESLVDVAKVTDECTMSLQPKVGVHC